MTQEEKQLLLKDLCARLPYEVKCQWVTEDTNLLGIIVDIAQVGYDINDYNVAAVEDIKPYLRPMSSMTEEEKQEYEDTCNLYETLETYDWLNAHHFDYRGLIEKGLALEAPVDMYKTE